MIRFLSAIALCSTLLFSTPYALAGDDNEYAEYFMTKDEIIKVQTNMIEYGWGTRKTPDESLFIPNGKLDDKTISIIKNIQMVYFMSLETGFLTEKQFRSISNWSGPTGFTWGGISAAPNGTYAIVSNRSSGVGAFTAAESDCMRETSLPCKTITGFLGPNYKKLWLSAVRCTGKINGVTIRSVGLYSGWESPESVEVGAWRAAQHERWELTECDKPVLVSPDKGRE